MSQGFEIVKEVLEDGTEQVTVVHSDNKKGDKKEDKKANK